MPRSLWSGQISFGLVNVPVKLVTAIRDKSVHFHMLSPEGDCRLRRKLYCPETGTEYDFSDTARGFEVAPDQYVLVKDEELDALTPEAGRAIEIQQFVDLAELDPLYFDRAYLLMPGEGGGGPYRLLVDAMGEAGRVGIARFVMRQRQHLAAIRVVDLGDEHGQALVLHTMHYAQEVAALADPPETLDEETKAPPQKQVKVAGQLIEAMTEPFDPTAFTDDYREKVEALIESKKEGQPLHEASADQDEPPRSINLMDALKKSVEDRKGTKSRGKKKTA